MPYDEFLGLIYYTKNEGQDKMTLEDYNSLKDKLDKLKKKKEEDGRKK